MFSKEQEKQLMIRSLELEYEALCKDLPEEKLWQKHLLRKLKQLKEGS